MEDTALLTRITSRNATYIGIVIVALIEIIAISSASDDIKGDAVQYLQIAENLYEHQSYSMDGETPTRALQPVYPIFLSVFYWMLGESLLIVRVVQAILGLLSFVFLSRLSRQILGESKSRVAILLVSLYAPIWMNCSYILSETVTIFLISLFMLIFRKGLVEGDFKDLFLSGLLLAIGILTRPILIATALLIWIPFLLSFHTSKKRLASFAWLLVGVVLLLFPWALRNSYCCDHFTPLTPGGAGNILFASNDDTRAARDSLLYIDAGLQESRFGERSMYSIALENIFSDPMGFIWRGLKRNTWVWTIVPGSRSLFHVLPIKLASYAASAAMILLAIIGTRQITRRSDWVILFLPGFSFSLLFFFSHTSPRYLLPIIAFVIILSGAGLEHVWRFTRHRTSR